MSRYPGSRIQTYTQVDFDPYPLALGVEDNRPSKVQNIEGKVTKIGYVNPTGRSAFEIYSNYGEALKKAGFEILWSCEATGCGQPMYWNPVNGLTASGSLRENRYLTVRGKVGDRTVTVAMAVNLRPESKPALDEVAARLKNRAGLRLMVVGHTDSTGTLDLNMRLSADRAAAVVKALTSTYGVAAAQALTRDVPRGDRERCEVTGNVSAAARLPATLSWKPAFTSSRAMHSHTLLHRPHLEPQFAARGA